MRNFLQSLKEKAKQDPKRIVFPEGFEPRILTAAVTLLKEGTAVPILLGKEEELHQTAKDLCLDIDWDQVDIVDPGDKDIYTAGAEMVEQGDADGMIAGLACPTSETIRSAIKIIKTKERFHKVSGFFFMILNNKVLLFSDCAVIPEPDAHDLADIAIDTAETAQRFGIEPKIAMLSFSTNGSADHPEVTKVRQATKMVKERRPDLIVEGEMQVDAALVPDICLKKFPDCQTPGEFNVLIFPNLAAGNIAYKLVQQLAGATAIGPILQGLNKPVNDLSRGCSAADVVDLAALTTVEAQGLDSMPTPIPEDAPVGSA
jgi:phosphate acetyltransferase